MANQDNVCKDLEVEDLYSKSKNTLEDLYMLQKNLQEKVFGFDFEKMRSEPLNKMKDFFLTNMWAMSDEMHETMDALGGMHDGIGSGAWKYWKHSNKKSFEMSFNDLSENDKKELKMEIIDAQHFLWNLAHAVGMTTDELFNYYFSKNKENIARQKNGY